MKPPEEYQKAAWDLFKKADIYFLGTGRNRTLNGDIYEGFLSNVLRELLPDMHIARGIV